jgi:Holliday junction resolvase RusA-like endonuclease
VSFTFEIPGVIKGVNHGYHLVYVAGHPRIAKVPEVETWQVEVAYRARQAKPSGWLPGRRVRISYAVWFARAGRDADGILKFLLDGIATGLAVNDSIFLSTCVSSEVDKLNPRVVVTVTNEA